MAAQKKRRNLSAEAAAMFQMTSMSSEQVSAIGGGEKLADLMDDITCFKKVDFRSKLGF